VSPDGKRDRIVSRRDWYTAYGWSKDGSSLYGIAAGGNRHILLVRVEIATEKETRVADLGDQPPAFELGNFDGAFPYRGFSLHPDGKSFLTSVYRAKSDIWLLEDFDRPARLLDSLWRRR